MPTCTCSSIWMLPACSSSSSSWSFTLASRSRCCFLTLASEASSLDSWEDRSCSSSSSCCIFMFTEHNSLSLSYRQKKRWEKVDVWKAQNSQTLKKRGEQLTCSCWRRFSISLVIKSFSRANLSLRLLSRCTSVWAWFCSRSNLHRHISTKTWL